MNSLRFVFVIVLSSLAFLGHCKLGCAAIIESASVHAVDVDDVVKIVDIAIERLSGARGAAVAAIARDCPDDWVRKSAAAAAGWFGDTGLLTALAETDCGIGEAQARNKLIGKIARATADGEASARAVLTWRGKVEWEALAPIELPDPSTIKSASLVVNYSMFADEIGVQTGQLGSGVFSLRHFWNGQQSFNGSVEMVSVGTPVFTGDLASYASEFSNTARLISAQNITFTDTVAIPISYNSFFSTHEVSANLSGRMRSIARSDRNCPCSVPEPSTWVLFATGMLALVIRLRRDPRLTGPTAPLSVL